MENAVDALKMGAAVMIFVLALSVSITAFSEARIASTVLLDYRDREAGLGESDYWYPSDNTQRTVGLETIIPSIYRSMKENYKVVFDFKNNEDDYLYIKEIDGEEKKINTIELSTNESFGDVIIRIILYGKDKSGVNSETIQSIQDQKKIIFRDDSLYDRINDNNKMFKEYSGIFIQSESNTGKSKAPDADKTIKKVITYKEE